MNSEHIEKKGIFKNTAILSFAEIYNIACGIVLIILLARTMGASNLGLFSFAFSLGTVIYIISFFGINDFIIREIARQPHKKNDYFGNSIIIRIGIMLLCLVILESIFRIINYPFDKKLIFYLIVFSRLIDSLLYTLYAFFRAYQKMIYEGIIRFFLNSVSLTAGIVFLLKYDTLKPFAISQIVIYAVFFVITLIVSAKVIDVKLSNVKISFLKASELIKMSFHLSLIKMLIVLYVHFNTILLTLIKGETQTGIYAAGFRFISAFGFLAVSFTAAVFPVMSKMGVGKIDVLLKAYKKTSKYLLIMGIFISAILASQAKSLILLIYGQEFSKSILPLSIMSLTPIFMFLNTGTSYLLFSMDREKSYLATMSISLLVVLILNLILIPLFGYIGASITTLAPEVFMFLVLCFFVFRIFKKNPYGFAVKPILAGLVSFIAGLFLAQHFNAIISSAIVASIFITSLIILKTFSKEEYMIARSLFSKSEKAYE